MEGVESYIKETPSLSGNEAIKSHVGKQREAECFKISQRMLVLG